MEIKTDWEIEQERIQLLQKCEFKKLTERKNKQWVAVDDLMDFINNERDNGNLDGGGFSPALCLSKVLKYLEKGEKE